MKIYLGGTIYSEYDPREVTPESIRKYIALHSRNLKLDRPWITWLEDHNIEYDYDGKVRLMQRVNPFTQSYMSKKVDRILAYRPYWTEDYYVVISDDDGILFKLTWEGDPLVTIEK